MPEAVYIAKQQQAQALQAAFKPRVRHPSGHQTTHSKFIDSLFFWNKKQSLDFCKNYITSKENFLSKH